ncbi:MAG TPA: DUF2182 domain-containing protein [Longimicrobium sp.]|nr:DUF2182 domain-containing protein [Longimicrobium sp.]
MTAATRAPVPDQPHRISDRHPEWGVLLAATAAWAFLAMRPDAPAHHHHGPAHGAGPDVPGLAAMVVAMMLPLTITSLRQAALSGPRSRRRWSLLAFLAGYLGVWIPAMLLIDIGWKRLLVGGTAATVATMLIAALWELAPPKQRRVHGCGTGWPAGAGHPFSGVAAGGRCVLSCWALMAVCVAFAHDLRVMAALFFVQLVARQRPASPPVLAALAVLVVCLASLALRTVGPHAT